MASGATPVANPASALLRGVTPGSPGVALPAVRHTWRSFVSCSPPSCLAQGLFAGSLRRFALFLSDFLTGLSVYAFYALVSLVSVFLFPFLLSVGVPDVVPSCASGFQFSIGVPCPM